MCEISDYIVDEGVCLKPIGGAINLEIFSTQVGPEGLITVTIGYNNSILRGFDPSSFRMVHEQVATWIDVTLSDGVDTDAMTVTGQTNTTGPFSIAVERRRLLWRRWWRIRSSRCWSCSRLCCFARGKIGRWAEGRVEAT